MTLARTGWRNSAAVALIVVGLATGVAGADEPVVTTLADYEDDSVAARITEVENVLATDCAARMAAIPARGQRSLTIEIGATERNAAAACDLRFRLATAFDQADRVATYAWIKQGAVDLQFRVRDAAGAVFQTAPLPVKTHNRWIRLVAELSPRGLQRVARDVAGEDAPQRPPARPIQILGYRIRASGIGQQTVFLDDLEVEHRAGGAGMLRGEFSLDEPTHIYAPGAEVRAAVVLENISRQRALPLSVRMAWLRADGSELATTRTSLNLPAGGPDYRSRQRLDFSQRISEPGLHRLVARVRGPGWNAPPLETTIAVTYTNRALPRGRATFFGVRTNLLREPLADQLLEIDIADEIGVQLLALETPWRMIEPSPGSYDFAALDRLINRITQRDIAAMIALTEPPDWLPVRDENSWSRQTVLLESLARRYGPRISAYQPQAPDPEDSTPLTSADLAAIERIRERIAKIQPDAEVWTPPLPVRARETREFPTFDLPPQTNVRFTFETDGDPVTALGTLEAFAAHRELKWNGSHRWLHRAGALSHYGALHDAVAVLRHYVRAAREGVGGVVWFDLRDDTNDSRHAELMKGLVQRDFSPKTPLLGFANAVGMLHGLRYAGEVTGVPPQFESALFIGGNRQVAVLFPKPNRVLPAVLAPYQVVNGVLSVFDFDRRAQPLTHYAGFLARVTPGPCFVTLDAQRAQVDPRIGLARPWLRMPATVYCGREATFTIEIDAPGDLRRSYLQLVLPPDAPVESSLSSRSLRARAGETLSFDVTLTRAGDEPLKRDTLTVRLRLEGESVAFPIRLMPLPDVRPLKSSAKISDAGFVIGRLTAPQPDDRQANADDVGALHVGYEARQLDVAIALPATASPDAILQVGIAVENADTHAEVQIERLTTHPRLQAVFGTTPSQRRGWRCRWIDGPPGAPRFCHLTIPTASLGPEVLEPGMRLLLAVRYVEPSAESWSLPRELEWGSGLGGSRSTAEYRWIRLANEPANQ